MRACTNRRLMRSLLLLISISGCSLLLAVNMASDTLCKTAAVDQLRHLHAEIRGHVPSSYDVAAGYWHMDVNYTAPPVSLLARSRYLVASKNSSCWDLAAAQREPFTAQYHPQQHPPTVSGWLLRTLCAMRSATTRHRSSDSSANTVAVVPEEHSCCVSHTWHALRRNQGVDA